MVCMLSEWVRDDDALMIPTTIPEIIRAILSEYVSTRSLGQNESTWRL